jgi:hypothetical protein
MRFVHVSPSPMRSGERRRRKRALESRIRPSLTPQARASAEFGNQTHTDIERHKKHLPGTADKILNSVKGLRDHMQPGEQPIINIPAFWDNGQQSRSVACDAIVTNQRLLGYYLVRFPRERLFLDELPLTAIRAVTLRQRSFEPVFREIMVRGEDRVLYIRAPRQKIETLFASLQTALEASTSTTKATIATEEGSVAEHAAPTHAAPTYERQTIRQPFEGSSLNITILLAGGILLEILGILFWSITQNAQIGLPLAGAGFIVWLTGMLLRRRRQ